MSTNAQRRRAVKAAEKAARLGMTEEQRQERELDMQITSFQRNIVSLGPNGTKPMHLVRSQRRGHAPIG